MENLKELVANINKEHPREIDLRMLSLKNFYLGLKKNKKYKEWRILKLICHLYPNIILKNDFRTIEDIVINPKGKRIGIRDRHDFTSFEEYALKRAYNGCIPQSSYVSYYLSDLLEYFGIKV